MDIFTWFHFDLKGSFSKRKSLLSLELKHRWMQRHNAVCLHERFCSISAHSNMNRHALKPVVSLFSQENISTVCHLQPQSYLYFSYVFIVESLKIYPRHSPLSIKVNQRTLSFNE